MGSVEEAIAALARRQQGNVTYAQLLSLGLGPSAIYRRCQTGRLYPEHHGVYGVGRRPTTALERASAAVLACGPRAALSHQSAFTLWGLDHRWRFPVHVSIPSCRKRPGIITHRIRSLARADTVIHLGLRVTSPARTFLDCAPGMSRRRLLRALADARRSGHLKPAALQDILDRNPTHPGHASLAGAISAYQPTRSEFESAFLRFCQRHGLPTPQINAQVAGYEVDALFADHRLIVELDGWAYHQDRHSFEGDRERDAATLAAGHATVRLTWERFRATPAREAARLKTIMDGLRPA